MVIISKLLFDEKITSDISCKSVLHPWTNNCIKANMTSVATRCFSGVFCFYASIYLVKLLTNHKKLSKTYMKKIVNQLLRSWCYGVSYAALTLNGVCLNYNILGTFHYYTVGFLPGLLAGLSLLFENNENRLLNSLLWSTLVIEALLKNLYHFQIIHYSIFRETLMFMVVSSLLMYIIRKRSLKGQRIPPTLWIYYPTRNIFTLKSYLTEIIKYFALGYGLNSAKSLCSVIVNFRKSSMKMFFRAIFNQKNVKFGMVLGAYAALFRGSLFLFEKSNCYKETTNVALAGFIAGISYYIKPTINILAIATVTVIQILLKENFKGTKSTKLVLIMLIYMFSNGILFQNRFIAPITCPKYYVNMLQMASQQLIDDIYHRLINKYLKT